MTLPWQQLGHAFLLYLSFICPLPYSPCSCSLDTSKDLFLFQMIDDRSLVLMNNHGLTSRFDVQPSGAEKRCARESVADEAAHLWPVAKFVPAATGDPHDADVLATAQ